MTATTKRRARGPLVMLVLWLALTIALIVAVRSVPWGQVVAEVRGAQTSWLLLAIGANFLILPLWALEWRILVPGVKPVRFRTMFEVVSVTASILNSVPFLAGEASAVGLLVGRAHLSRGAALSMLAMDQLLVAFAKLAVLGTALLLAPLPSWVRAGGLALVSVLGLALATLVPLAHYWSPLRARLLAVPGLARRVLATAVEFGQHLDALREPRRLWRVASLAIAKKALELAAIIAVAVSFGIEPSLTTGLLVLASLALSTLIPVAPANLGVYEATVFAIYRLSGVPADTALGVALVQHVCFLIPSLTTGYLILTVRQLKLRALRAS
jgi:glycosyltransferase 2 family protein